MRFSFLFLVFFLLSSSAWAYELIMIQAVSDSKRTFITRNGKRQGLMVGQTASFTAENVSILAKAVSVTGNFTRWELINKNTILPFEKGSIVTFYSATEYLWALAPEKERRKYIKSEITTLKKSWVLKGGLTRGLSESVSGAPANEPNRGGFLGELYWERDVMRSLSFDLGYRYERETINYPGASFTTSRNLIIADLIYYFDNLQDYIPGRLFLAAGLGYGLSNTSTVGLEQSGPVAILPALKLGVSLPFNQEWEFIMDGAFESLNTREEREDGSHQSTNQTNFKVGFGLRHYL